MTRGEAAVRQGRTVPEEVMLRAPLLLLALGLVELAPALAGGRGEPGGSAVPGLLPVALAVVTATLLPVTPPACRTKLFTALGAGAAALGQGVLVVQAVPGTAPSRPQLLALAVGLGTVLTLVAWAWAEYRAASAALAPAAPGLSVAPGDPAVPGLSVAPGDPAAPGLSVAPVREPGHLPGSADTPPSAPWHRSSTPWPKRDEDDPEGTVIRPPRHI